MAKTPTSPTRRPHFFKVLLDGFYQRLKIPPAFIKHIEGDKEARRARILSPLGKIFHVEIEGDMEDLYFGDGWQQFVSAHDLGLGYFLVFSYEGHLVFHVRVFDHTACQKEYSPAESDGINHRETERHTRNSSHIVKGISKRPFTRSNKSEAAEGGERSQPQVRKTRITSISCVMAKTAVSGAVTPCGNSPSFKTVITPSKLTKYVQVPIAFKSENPILRTQGETVLRDPDGRVWAVGICHMRRNRSVLRRGWKAFAESNNLKLGDECTFELVSWGRRKLCVFQVHIDRGKSARRGNLPIDGQQNLRKLSFRQAPPLHSLAVKDCLN